MSKNSINIDKRTILFVKNKINRMSHYKRQTPCNDECGKNMKQFSRLLTFVYIQKSIMFNAKWLVKLNIIHFQENFLKTLNFKDDSDLPIVKKFEKL